MLYTNVQPTRGSTDMNIQIKRPEKARDRFGSLYETLRNRICLLDYAPGARLSEAILAAEFGLSRTPLRRVLARLESEGLVTSVHGVGTFVTDVRLEELEQTYRLRLELAELIAKLDPVDPSLAQIAEFRALSERAQKLRTAADLRSFAELNMDYFLTTLLLTTNQPLQRVSERLYYRTTRIWLQSVTSSLIDLENEADHFAREIDGVLHALEAGDLHAAALIQRAHLSMCFERLRKGWSAGD
jgi:DNA-binding GntR family transcriptional regulator